MFYPNVKVSNPSQANASSGLIFFALVWPWEPSRYFAGFGKMSPFGLFYAFFCQDGAFLHDSAKQMHDFARSEGPLS